jgi:hypothetical protein
VQEGVTEVSIPIVLVTGSEAIAGAELEFTFSEGLEYLRYQQADGIENPLSSFVDGTQFVGFFSLDNRYVPAHERLSFGSLVFSYTGSQAQTISVNEIKLHTKTGSGTNTEVTTKKTTNIVAIPVTRAGAAPSGQTGQQGTGTSTSPVASTSGGGGSAGEATQTDAVELPADEGASTSRSSLASSGSSAQTAIPDADAPLSGGEVPAGSEQQLQALVGALLVAAVIAAGVLYFVFSRRKERRREEATSQEQV